MAGKSIYHDGMRRLQDARDTRRIADRLEAVIVHSAFSAEDREFIERCPMVFVAGVRRRREEHSRFLLDCRKLGQLFVTRGTNLITNPGHD